MRKSLLIVDSDPQTVDLAKALSPDYRSFSAANAESALSLAKKAIFDLYLLNECLPDCSGMDLCTKLRSFDRNTPIIVLFEGALDDRHQAAVNAGANACIDKLDGMSRLADTVAVLLRWAEDMSLNSRIAEIAAIRDSIEEKLLELDGRAQQSNHNAQLARIRLMNIIGGRQDVTDKAYLAFIGAGGTKAYFERWWPSVLNEVI